MGTNGVLMKRFAELGTSFFVNNTDTVDWKTDGTFSLIDT